MAAAILAGMENQPKRDGPNGSHVLTLVVCLLIALPVLYCLSVGPASVLVTRGALSQPTATTFYWPLIQALEQSESLKGVFVRYIMWCYAITGTPMEG